MARKRKSTRQPYGGGGLYWRADIERWQASIIVGRTAAGNPRRRYKSFAENEKNLGLAWLAEQRTALLAGARLDDSSTLRETFEEWLEQGVTLRGWESTTKKGYEDIFRRLILPQLGHMRVRDLMPDDIRRHLQDLAKAKYSATMLHRVRTYLGMLLRDAVRRRVLSSNPIDAVPVPPKPRPKKERWSEKEVAQLVAECLRRDDQAARYLVVALASGCRIEELLGLTWGSVDLDRGVFRVERVAPAGPKKTLRDGAKNEGSVRTVHLDPLTVGVLQRQREYVNKLTAARAELDVKRAEKGKGPLEWADLDLVFCTSKGTVFDRGTLRRYVNEIIEAADVTHIKLYASRHTHGSILADAGVNVHAIAERFGHTDLQNLQHYVASSQAAQQAVAAVIGDLLARSNHVAVGTEERSEAEANDGAALAVERRDVPPQTALRAGVVN